MKIINKLDDMSPNLYTEAYVNELKEELKLAKEDNLQLQQRIDKVIEILKDGLLQLDTRPREQVYIEQYLENAIDELKGEDK